MNREPSLRLPGGAPRHRRPVLAVVLATALAGTAHASPATTPTHGELLPLYGGDVRSVIFDPGNSQRAFAGTASGQLFRSDDGGRSWNLAGDEIAFPGWVVATLRFDPGDPSALWAGLWGPWGGGGVAVSHDLGRSWSWRASAELGREAVYALAISTGNPRRLFAGTRGGVWRSLDGGLTWRKVSAGIDGLEQVSSLAVDPHDPDRVLAGTWRRAYRSEDGGSSWVGVFDGMVLDTEVFRLVAPAESPGMVWASTCGWIYRGDAFGTSWKRFRDGLDERRTPALDLLSPDRILAGTVHGIFLSADGGANFRAVAAPPLSVHALAHPAGDPDVVLAATDGGGVWRSADGGQSFEPSSTGIGAGRVAALAELDGSLWVALAASGPLPTLERSVDGGLTFAPAPVPPSPVLELAAFGGRLYAGTEAGLFVLEEERWRAVPPASGVVTRILRLEVAHGALLAASSRHRYRLERGRLREVARGEIDRRGLPTGDPRLPLVEAGDGSLRLHDAEGAARAELFTSLPRASILAVALVGNRLLVGTSGLGLRAIDLQPALGVEAAQSRSSDSSRRR